MGAAATAAAAALPAKPKAKAEAGVLCLLLLWQRGEAQRKVEKSAAARLDQRTPCNMQRANIGNSSHAGMKAANSKVWESCQPSWPPTLCQSITTVIKTTMPHLRCREGEGLAATACVLHYGHLAAAAGLDLG